MLRIIVAVALLITSRSFTQTNFYSQSNSNPKVLSNWNSLRNGTGTTPLNFTSDNQIFVVQNGHYMTISAINNSNSDWSVSGSNSKVLIESFGKLSTSNDNGFIATLDMEENATFIANGGSISSLNFGTVSTNAVFEYLSSPVKYGTYPCKVIITSGTISFGGGNCTFNDDLIVNSGILRWCHSSSSRTHTLFGSLIVNSNAQYYATNSTGVPTLIFKGVNKEISIDGTVTNEHHNITIYENANISFTSDFNIISGYDFHIYGNITICESKNLNLSCNTTVYSNGKLYVNGVLNWEQNSFSLNGSGNNLIINSDGIFNIGNSAGIFTGHSQGTLIYGKICHCSANSTCYPNYNGSNGYSDDYTVYSGSNSSLEIKSFCSNNKNYYDFMGSGNISYESYQNLIYNYNNNNKAFSPFSSGTGTSISGKLQILSSSANGVTLTIKDRLNSAGSVEVSGGYVVFLTSAADNSRTFNCYGDFIVTGGTVELNLSNTAAANLTLNIKGDFIHSGGTILKSKNSATIVLNGSQQQNISSCGFYGSSSAYSVNVTFDNASGFILNQNFSVSGILNMLQGNIYTGPYYLASGISTDVPGSIARTSGIVIGYFKKWINSTGSYLFPVGTSDYYRPLTISYNSAPSCGSLKVSFRDELPWNSSLTQINDNGYILDSYSSKGFWDAIAENGLAGNYNLNLQANYFGPGGISSTNFPLLRIIKSSDNGQTYSADGSHSPATNDNVSPYLNRTNISTGFSRFAVAGNHSDGNPLDEPFPVLLFGFSALVFNNNSVKLSWQTSFEQNNNGFEIERKIKDNNLWHSIGFIKGAGNINVLSKYYFYDNFLNSGMYSYRLKQIDYNGNFEYFELEDEVHISKPNMFSLGQNFPNPFNSSTNITFSLPDDISVSLLIFDVTGRLVKNIYNNFFSTSGYHKININLSDLTSGTYYYRFLTDKFTDTKKFVFIK